MRELELYIHIPYCVSKCKYCDFLSAPSNQIERQEYVKSLCGRIRSYGDSMKAYHIISIFLGGGTPSVLESEQTKEILKTIKESFRVDEDAEITTELNPGTVTEEKLKVYKEIGINRLSIGLQSADNSELRMLGRIHTYEEFLETYQLARKIGFSNINIDLMSAIPGQTMESYENTLKKVLSLGPEHISAYSLIIEEGTPFYERYGDGQHAEELPDEDEERLMYVRTKELLAEQGYERYEISNYAKAEYECRHNIGYWDRVEYLGIGAGASSLIGHKRFTEPLDIVGRDSRDILKNAENLQELSTQEEMEEFFFLGLRKMKGVSRDKFRRIFKKEIEDVYKEKINKLCDEGLLIEEDGMIRLTEKGIDISNYVMSEFLL